MVRSRSLRTWVKSIGPALLWPLVTGAAPNHGKGAPASQPAAILVIEDNDFLGPARTNIQSIIPLLANPAVKVLGLTVVTGDGWEAEEREHTLRFLEIAGRTDVPVFDGAVQPLVNSRERLHAWEAQHGKLLWNGAWSDQSLDPAFHPSEPDLIHASPEGAPTVKAAPGSAAQFLIEQVHHYPGQVTIIANGPLTNLALAVKLDPQFASLAKQLVFSGAYSRPGYDDPHPEFAFDFNLTFDPEAAHIVLTADWPRILAVGDVSLANELTPDLMGKIGARSTAVTRFLQRNAVQLPLWDELTSAIAVDPTLAVKTSSVYLDVDVDHGAGYGTVLAWTDASRPHLGERLVEIVSQVDNKRFLESFVAAAQSDFTKPR